ncbi:hypothetical protein BH23BAC3_BH23BAC3_29750 [soil metagenome]
MNEPEYPYDESLLQWVWGHLQFDTQSLQTECGRALQIVDPGKQNHGAGPDFSGSVIRMEGAELHGDVELHIHPQGWVQHRHSASREFNRVILHVVYDAGRGFNNPAIVRPDGTAPPLLILKPYLQKPLRTLLEQSQMPVLPCAGNMSFINQDAFEKQVEKAHKQYFEYKTDFLLGSYKSNLPVSKAWLHMLTHGIFHTLGIPVNRGPMVDLHDVICEDLTVPDHPAEFSKIVDDLAFTGSASLGLNWKHTGMRPASRPEVRVKQAASLFYAIHHLSFKEYLSSDLRAWQKIVQSLCPADRPGSQMLKILEQTIYLPAVYLLGDFLHSQHLKQNSYAAWRNIRGGVPGEVMIPFKESGFEINKQTRKPGLAHHLKRYCRKGNCHRCEVFKKAISS